MDFLRIILNAISGSVVIAYSGREAFNACFLKRIRRDVPIDETAVGVDMAIRGFREQGALLGEKHTVEYLRAGEIVAAGLDQWVSQEQWESEGRPDMLDAAHDHVTEILARHTVPDFDPALERELERIVADF